MRTNVATPTPRTHEGAPASLIMPIEQLKRTVLACLLWEDTFYESGKDVAERIRELVPQCQPHLVAGLAIEAREQYKLRHAPLMLVRELARYPSRFGVAATLERVIQRADELAEFVALYWKDGKRPLAKQVKKGLARAFAKFDEYQFAKYNRVQPVKLRDVLFLCHAKPQTPAQEALYKKIAENTLAAPDTWEVALSGGAGKKETFERLLREGKLGYMALLRNLRNMHAAGVDPGLVFEALIGGAHKSRALPFRFVAAARAVPEWRPFLDKAMQIAVQGLPKLPGRTVVLVDVSGSMSCKVSGKSDLTRMDAAAALAVLVNGMAEQCVVLTFSNNVVEVPTVAGLELVDRVISSQTHSGTYLGNAMLALQQQHVKADRIIVITDEQTHDAVPAPGELGRGYMINVGTSQHGVGYGDWLHINGFSEAVVNYIQAIENSER